MDAATREEFERRAHSEDKELILKYFEYGHLPEKLQAISKAFHVMAHDVVMQQPRSAERTVALRKLLEAKDATVRAALN